jgi:hypothetical protein
MSKNRYAKNDITDLQLCAHERFSQCGQIKSESINHLSQSDDARLSYGEITGTVIEA